MSKQYPINELKHQNGKKNNLCNNAHCKSCYYVDGWTTSSPYCDYMAKEGKMRMTEPGAGCTKWRKKGKEGK